MNALEWELTDISVAKYGWELRLPTKRALKKLGKIYSVNISDDIIIEPYGADVKSAFRKAYMDIREASHCVSGDNALINFLTSSYGYSIKTNLHDALAGLDGESSTTNRLELDGTNNKSYSLIVGNDEPIFMTGNNIGIAVTGTEAGFGDYDSETDTYSITVQVRNIITGAHYEETKTIAAKLFDSETIYFFINDEITAMVDPGVVEIIFLNNPDSAGKYPSIYTSYCLFGNTPAEGFIPTGENDYIYTSYPNDHSETMIYKGDANRISTPETLNNEPLTIIGPTTFSHDNVMAVKIKEGVTKIE